MLMKKATSQHTVAEPVGSVCRGLTMVELLVVLSVIGLLIALLLPAVQRTRESARRINCANKMRQLGLGLHHYESLYGSFPAGSQVADWERPPGYSKSFGWTVAVLPHIDQLPIYAQFDFDLDCQIHHRQLTKQVVTSFVCPSDPMHGGPVEFNRSPDPHPVYGSYWEGGWGITNYLGVSGIGGLQPATHILRCNELDSRQPVSTIHAGIFFGNSSVRLTDIKDGTSNTFLLGERGGVPELGKWGGPGLLFACPLGVLDVVLPGVLGDRFGGGLRPPRGRTSDELHFWSSHDGGCYFAFADGSIRFLSYSTDHDIQRSLSTRDQGEVISSDF